MNKSRYSDSQILSILKQAETGTPVPVLAGNTVKVLLLSGVAAGY